MLFEKAFWSHLSEFNDLQQSKNDAPDNPWHRRISKHPTSVNQNQVADRYKKRYVGSNEVVYRGELNTKIEAIRNGSAQQPLSPADEKYILDNYPIGELPREANKPKQLGNTGIEMSWDPVKGCHMLKPTEEKRKRDNE